MSKYFAPQRWMLYRFRAAWMSQAPLASDVLLISSASNERTIKVCAGNTIRGMKYFSNRRRLIGAKSSAPKEKTAKTFRHFAVGQVYPSQLPTATTLPSTSVTATLCTTDPGAMYPSNVTEPDWAVVTMMLDEAG